jgi:hypothetical protein
MLAAFFGLDFLVGIREQRQPLRIPSLAQITAWALAQKVNSHRQLSSAAKADKQNKNLSQA